SHEISVKQQRKHEGLIHFMLDNYSDYKLEIYPLPFSSYYELQDKPSGYLEQTKNRVIIGSGSGNFIYFEKSEIGKADIQFKPIDSNIKSIIKDSLFHTVGSRSIKDLKIIDNFLYLTYTKRVSEKCYNLSVLRAAINYEKLNFDEVFSPTECLIDQYRKQSGGRIFPYKDDKILLSVGIFNHNLKAQSLDNMFGKIIAFEPMNNKYEIISIGHRNPQGLYYDAELDIIINTEHQALGGDEVNLNKGDNLKNYGWPMASYGSHYGRKVIEGQPLHKSHSKHGFDEPLIYFTPAIGISQIIKAPKSFNDGNSIDLLVSSMGDGVNEGGDMSIHHLRMNDSYNEIEYKNLIPIGERIRDIEVLNGSNDIMLILESIPAIGILSNKEFSCTKKLPPCNINKFYTKSYGKKEKRNPYKNLLP
ncbi:PQQ-dependent sugar dehydrogenase, partial [Pelagibacteraceae bacterium]|nr:PQQ-dependent sugar dehydrogenase [Pelagibacteraceae bacterium]